MHPRKAVFLDRDDTIIIDKVYLNDPEQIEYLPDVFEALRLLKEAGFLFVVVTNQSGVPRGLVQIENIEEIHRRIGRDFAKHEIEFAAYYYAPYSVESNHWMRKPNPGMLEQATKEHNLDLKRSWMIGDRLSDVTAGHKAGCRSILLSGPQGKPEENLISLVRQPEVKVSSLLEAAKFILSQAETDPKQDHL